MNDDNEHASEDEQAHKDWFWVFKHAENDCFPMIKMTASTVVNNWWDLISSFMCFGTLLIQSQKKNLEPL